MDHRLSQLDQSFSIDGDLSPAQTQFGNNTLTDWFWSQELRISMDFTPKLRTTIGGFYSDEKTTYYTLQDIRYVAVGVPGPVCAGPPFNGLPTPTCPHYPLQFLGNDPVKTTSKAAFGTLFYDLTDKLSLTGGARYSWDTKTYTYYRLSFDGTTPNPFLGALNDQGGPVRGQPARLARQRRLPLQSGRDDLRVVGDRLQGRW